MASSSSAPLQHVLPQHAGNPPSLQILSPLPSKQKKRTNQMPNHGQETIDDLQTFKMIGTEDAGNDTGGDALRPRILRLGDLEEERRRKAALAKGRVGIRILRPEAKLDIVGIQASNLKSRIDNQITPKITEISKLKRETLESSEIPPSVWTAREGEEG